MAASFRRYVIIAEFWRPESPQLEHFQDIFAFLEKRPLMKKKVLFGKFTSRHRSTLLCAKFVKIVRREIGESVRYLPDQKNIFRLPLKLWLLRGSRPSSAMASPQHLADNFPNFIQIGFGGVIAGRVKAVQNAP